MFNSNLSGIKSISSLSIGASLGLPDQNTALAISGNIRFNTITNKLQLYSSGNWVDIDTSLGSNYWQISGTDLTPIAPYTGILTNNISSIAGDDDLNFNTSGSGKYIFNIESSIPVNPGRIQWLAPDILTAGGEVDFYLGGSVSPANFSLFGYGHNSSTFNNCYCYFGLLSSVGGSTDKRMRIYGSGEMQIPGNLRMIAGANLYCDNVYEANTNNGTVFNNQIWVKNLYNKQFAFFGTKAASPAGTGIEIGFDASYPFINSRDYLGNYADIQINSNDTGTGGGNIKLSGPGARIFSRAPIKMFDIAGAGTSLEGDLGYDYTAHQIAYWDGSAWKHVTGVTMGKSTENIKSVIPPEEKNNSYGVDNATYKYLCRKWQEQKKINVDLLNRVESLEKKMKLFSDKVEEKFIEKKIDESKGGNGELGNSLLFI